MQLIATISVNRQIYIANYRWIFCHCYDFSVKIQTSASLDWAKYMFMHAQKYGKLQLTQAHIMSYCCYGYHQESIIAIMDYHGLLIPCSDMLPFKVSCINTIMQQQNQLLHMQSYIASYDNIAYIPASQLCHCMTNTSKWAAITSLVD